MTLAPPAIAAEKLETPAMSLTIRDGVVVGFTDRRIPNGWQPMDAPPLTGLRRIKKSDLWNDTAGRVARHTDAGLTCEAAWTSAEGRARVTTAFAPADDGSVVVTHRGKSGTPGIVGVQWGLVAPETWTVLAPCHSGWQLDASGPAGQFDLDYPMAWEAQFVLIQGPKGGVLIHAEDVAERFKTLHVKRVGGQFRIGFETRCTAPMDSKKAVEGTRWRIRPYRGDWLKGAALYRAWATRAFGLVRLEDRKPAWIRDAQLMVVSGLEAKLLEALAEHVDPKQTLVYVPSWRRDSYDRNYPDYTPAEGFAEKVKHARAMGYRVILHVNYFGCTPENPHYEALKGYHCRDPLSGELLYWDWQRADPPITFAYINPAAKAWRELFVRLMVELCERVEPDALHLDQTLCIFNHAGGPIDGFNMMQGNLALHRELREALPDVALSGEGLNEITCRYEAFAQRHVYGIHHADRKWDDWLIDLAHPISSSLLAPHTTIYGYLGMTNPRAHDYYFAWRKAYERFGVIPTFPRPTRDQITQAPPIVRVLLDEARWFQRNRPLPDFDREWPAEAVFAYRTDGGQAAYRRDAFGVALVDPAEPDAPISRRLTGSATPELPGTVPGWRAYNDRRLLGLDPARSYVYLPKPRDRKAFHVDKLPPTARVRRIAQQPDFAVIDLDDERAVVSELWRHEGPARSGEILRDGATNAIAGLQFHSDSGTGVRPQGEGIFAHPPWRPLPDNEKPTGASSDASTGLGSAWIEFDVALPRDKPARFETGVGLRTDHAAEQSDGVTFVVIVRKPDSKTELLRLSKHATRASPEPMVVDLSRLRGQAITLRLETHPGPKGAVTFDWALWARPRIVLSEPHHQMIRLVSPRRILGVIHGVTYRTAAPFEDTRYVIDVPLPGTSYLLFREPHTIEPPVKLTDLRFDQALIEAGRSRRPRSFMTAKVQPGQVGGEAKPGLFAHPPDQGQMHVDYLIKLPERPVRLIGFAGIRDGQGSITDGVGFRVAVNGEVWWSSDVTPDDKWVPFDVALARYANRPVVLSLITDSLGDFRCDWAQWGQPTLVPRP